MFSLIIPIYNRPEEIKELLESLLLSNYKKEYELIEKLKVVLSQKL